MAVVVASLKAFDAELTSVAPKRTLPTWYAGDPDHKLRPSGHNADDTPGSKAEDSDSDNIPEIRAGDYRLPLNAPFTPEQFIQWLVKKCRSGEVTWIKYIIFNKRIWAASSDWVTHEYTGKNKHDHHFHVSSKPDTKSENSTTKIGMRELLARPAPPKATKMLSVSTKFPELKKGMKDPVPGVTTSYIKRLQAVLVWLGGYDGKIDGDYGAKMQAAIKSVMANDPKRSSRDGSVVGEAEWRRIYGAW